MTPPILPQSPEAFCMEPSECRQVQSMEPLFLEKQSEIPPLKKLLTLCKENISKKILEEKKQETPTLLFSDIEPFLKEIESDTESDSDSADQPTPQKKKVENSPFLISEIPIPFLRPQLDLQIESSASVNSISAESLLLFDKMCSEMLVMTSESCSKTVLILQSTEFTNSPFYGAEVTLEEFSTAPKIFNVSIRANDSAIILIQSHLAGFMQLLEDRNFSFGINRIDTSILTGSSLSKESKELKKIKKNQDKISPLSEDPNEERTL